MTQLQVFNSFVGASALLDGVVLLALLYRKPRPGSGDVDCARRRVGVVWVAISLGCAALLFAAKLVAFTVFGVRGFGWARIFYVDAVIMLPAVCTVVLLDGLFRKSAVRRYTKSVYVLATLGVLGAPFGVYATCIEPFRLQTERATVPVRDASPLENPVRLGVLADIQTDRVTDYERDAVSRLMSSLPDIVLIPGDVLQCERGEYAEQIDAMRDVVMKLDAPGGAFYAQGDVDRLDNMRRLFSGTPVRMLVNEIAETRVGGQNIIIAGIELNYGSTAAARVIRQLIDMPRNGRVKIVLAHRPDVVMLLPENADVDLVVAGHTHGGQIVIPGFGPPVTLSQLPRNIGAGGLHEWNGNRIYISRGVGMERGLSPRLRVFCPPEISLLTLTSGHAPMTRLTVASPTD